HHARYEGDGWTHRQSLTDSRTFPSAVTVATSHPVLRTTTVIRPSAFGSTKRRHVSSVAPGARQKTLFVLSICRGGICSTQPGHPERFRPLPHLLSVLGKSQRSECSWTQTRWTRTVTSICG